MRENLKYWLALNKVKGLGPVKLKKLLEQYSSAQAACAALNCPLPDVDEELRKLSGMKAQAFTVEDAAYSQSLKNIHDPPPILYVKGALLPADGKAVAIVGTRKASRYGLEIAKKLASQLAHCGVTIVSGLALGIDTAAHQGALEAGGRTLAVLGSAIDKVYPVSNLALAKKIEASGALISEFPLGQEPDKWTFPQRNRIISGLSLGVIVVEGHYDSGALITAKEALEQGREVFAVPGNVELEQSKGPHWLIKQGAKLVETVEDVLEEFSWAGKITNYGLRITNEGRNPELNEEEAKIYKTLSYEPKHIDNIALEAGVSSGQAAGLLMVLEVKKAVRQLPGKMFILA